MDKWVCTVCGYIYDPAACLQNSDLSTFLSLE
jgi:rubredoxin